MGCCFPCCRPEPPPGAPSLLRLAREGARKGTGMGGPGMGGPGMGGPGMGGYGRGGPGMGGYGRY